MWILELVPAFFILNLVRGFEWSEEATVKEAGEDDPSSDYQSQSPLVMTYLV